MFGISTGWVLVLFQLNVTRARHEIRLAALVEYFHRRVARKIREAVQYILELRMLWFVG